MIVVPVRVVLILAAAAFGLASLVHGGVLVEGWEHRKAATAEGVIAAVLAAGLAGTWIYPGAARKIGLIAEGFALLGTFVGVFTIIVGIGPRTVPDLVFHALLIVGLGAGLTVTWRSADSRRT